MLLVKRGGRGDSVEERWDPCPERLSESSSARKGNSETEPGSPGDSEAERAERQGEGAQQEGEDVEVMDTRMFRADNRLKQLWHVLYAQVLSLQSELQFKEAEINEMKTKLLSSDKNKTASPVARTR